MLLRSRLPSVFRPVIRNEKERLAYVARVAALCVVAAVAIDVVNQLTFFEDWERTLRSWAISACVALVIAVPVAYAIARAHLELYRAKMDMEELSRTDPLTGLLNRRALLDPVAGCLPEVMALVIADIDRFKSVNDTHGHLVGDHVIKMVGRAMQTALSDFGQVGRIGGEEFALISSATSERLLERLWDFRDQIASMPIVVGSESVRITISIGVASRKDGQSLDDLFAEADRALYFAKASGRNRVVSASELPGKSLGMAEEVAGLAPPEQRKYRPAAGAG